VPAFAASPGAMPASPESKAEVEEVHAIATAVRNSIDCIKCRGFPVWLHVYDLGPWSKWALNSWASLGAFHCGIEVLGVEFSFGAIPRDDGDGRPSGLSWHHPKSHPRHEYRESVSLGSTPLCTAEIGHLLERLEKAWPARRYDCLKQNCIDFAEAFATGLRVPVVFPKWVHGLAKGITRNLTDEYWFWFTLLPVPTVLAAAVDWLNMPSQRSLTAGLAAAEAAEVGAAEEVAAQGVAAELQAAVAEDGSVVMLEDAPEDAPSEAAVGEVMLEEAPEDAPSEVRELAVMEYFVASAKDYREAVGCEADGEAPKARIAPCLLRALVFRFSASFAGDPQPEVV